VPMGRVRGEVIVADGHFLLSGVRVPSKARSPSVT
jgi:hypothetical protein